MVIFRIYHIFALFMKLCGCRFLYFCSLCDIRNEVIFLILEHSSLRWVKQKTNIKFWPLNPYYKRSDWKIWLSERFSEAVTSKHWDKKIHPAKPWNGAKLNYVHPPFGFIKSLRQNYLRKSHVKFMRKNKVAKTMCAKLTQLDRSK